MKRKILITAKLTFALAFVGGLLSSCSKWDEFKEYTKDGEIVYSGKLDSVKVFPGDDRIRIRAVLPADPKIVKARVFWNNMKDSVEFPIDMSKGRILEQIVPMSEGLKSFTLFTYDAKGNKSVPVYAVGSSLGTRYKNSIANRVVTAAVSINSTLTVNWVSADLATGPIFTEVMYSSLTGNKTAKVLATEDLTVINDLATTAKTFSYRTAYRPANSIDTFYTAEKTVTILRNVTAEYLSNVGPLTRATLSGRWGTLAAPWITNQAAKNKGGINGGYTSDAGGAINWETYGNTPVTNGIVYQATSRPLPAGKYIVEFDEYSEIQTNSSVYCVVAAGGNGIPVLADLSTALGSRALYNGAVINTAAPSLTDTRTVEFTLATSQVVSIGFLGNLASVPRGNYFRVHAIRLFSN